MLSCYRVIGKGQSNAVSRGRQHLSDVAPCSSIYQAHNPLIALLALGHFQDLLHLAVHAALHLPAGQDVACDLLLLYMQDPCQVLQTITKRSTG